MATAGVGTVVEREKDFSGTIRNWLAIVAILLAGVAYLMDIKGAASEANRKADQNAADIKEKVGRQEFQDMKDDLRQIKDDLRQFLIRNRH